MLTPGFDPLLKTFIEDLRGSLAFLVLSLLDSSDLLLAVILEVVALLAEASSID